MRRIILYTWICLGTGGTDVQAALFVPSDSLSADKAGRWALTYARALWLRSENSAGLGLDTTWSMAAASVSGQAESGSFRRPQQPAAAQVAALDAERIRTIRKLSFYGGFRFRQKWEKDIRWSDLLDPYRGTPYVLADSLGGDWKKQVFGLSAALATNPLFSSRLSLGWAVEYEVETGARQNDPRPLNYARHLKLRPGVIWSPGPGIRTGLSFGAGFFREEAEMENRLATAQRQYRLKGLSIHDAPTIFSLSVNRTYSGRDLSGGWQFEKKFPDATLMSSVNFGYYLEDTRDGITRPTLGGQFKRHVWSLSAIWRQDRPAGYGELRLEALQRKGTGREYHQVYDPASASWVTTFEGIFYRSEFENARIGYNRSGYTPDQRSVSWKWALSAGITKEHNRYLYNQVSDQQVTSAEAEAQAEKLLADRGHRTLRVFFSGLYRANMEDGLVYVPRGTNARAARELLYPDHAWLGADLATLKASLRYGFFPGARAGTQFYVSGTGMFVQGFWRREAGRENASRSWMQVSFGIFY